MWNARGLIDTTSVLEVKYASEVEGNTLSQSLKIILILQKKTHTGYVIYQFVYTQTKELKQKKKLLYISRIS